MDIERLFEKRPIAEIVEISTEDRERILKEAESLIFEELTSGSSLNGGSLTTIDSAMTRSMFEYFVRDEALTRAETPIVEINLATYRNALDSFKEFVQTTSDNVELLRSLWLSITKCYITDLFTKSERVFEPYIIGDLCERLYLDNRSAQAVLEELKKDNYVKVVDKQYDQYILSRTS